MTLKVIGAGPGRTGTMSLKHALEHLGYGPCHHMGACFGSRQQTEWFLEAAEGKAVDWNSVFEDYQAAVDWPAAAYYSELLKTFPDARVVFGYRQPEEWYRSVSETIFNVASSIPPWVRFLFPHAERLALMIEKTVWQNELGGKFQDREYALNFFEQRLKQVKAAVPQEKLLVHAAADGWEPLCAFLEVGVPNIPYPRLNESAKIKRFIRVLKVLNYLPFCILLAVSILIILSR